MADNINKQDLQDSNGELNRFNDSLRESIDLSRSLSKNVKSVTDALKLSKGANSELYADLSKYNDALKQAQSLSKRLLTGRVKEQEVSDALKNIEKTYGEYMTRNNKSFGERGRFTIRQKSLQEELNKLADKEVKRQEDISNADARIDSLRRDLAAQEAARQSTMSRTQRDIADRAIKAIKLQIREEAELIKVIEGGAKNNERIISRKTQELEKVNEIIEAHKELQKQYEEEIKNNKILLEAVQKQNTPVNKIAETFKNIQNILGPFTAIFNFLKSVAFDVSNQVTQLQKGLMLSSDEAYQVRSEFNDLAVASGNVLITTNALVASNAALGKQLGFNARFSNDAVVEFTKLTKQIGLSEEAAGGLAKLSKANGMTLEETKTTALGVSQALSSQYGIQLDQREVLEEVGKISGQTLAMFKGSVPALTQAVAQAKLLGTNLDTAKKQASALLDFESSIENELQAELLTGQQFNLERARSASLMGDLTTTMKELNNQGIDFNKFSNMNVIAQDKVAAALGLSTDELSDQLLKQQYMNMSREQVVALAGEEVANRLEAVSAQDKFNAAVEKMQDLFANIAGGPLGQLAEMMAGLLDNSAALYGIMAAIAGISFVKLIASLVATSATLASSAVAGGALAAFINPTSLIIGIAALATLGALIGSAMTSASEAAQPIGDMSYAKGKTLISTAEGGLFEPSPNDEIAVAPGISDMINRSQSTTAVQDNSSVVNAIASLNDTMKGVKDGVGQLYAKKSDIKFNVDSQNLGTAQIMGNYNLA
jgi:myosin heavy subunit